MRLVCSIRLVFGKRALRLRNGLVRRPLPRRNEVAVWYVAYRSDGATRMEIFRTREEALHAACGMLDDPAREDVRIGPMLAKREGNEMAEERLRGACEEIARDPG